MISIIIPHHQEDLRLMYSCLSSLDSQIGINFEEDLEIIIVNDDKDHTIKDFSLFSNIEPCIKQFFNEKTGYMGISRQIGIDNSSGDYLLFIDADDMLGMPMLICDLISRIKAFPDKDVFCYRFFEESILSSGQHTYLEHEHDFIWMFAKCYKKDFIIRNNIRFHEDILWHEDTYFNQVLLTYQPNIEYLNYLGYVWKCTFDSITRKNSAEYSYSSLCMYIDAIDKVIERVKLMVNGAAIIDKVSWLASYMYSCLQKINQVDFREKYKKDIEKKLSQFIKKWDNAKLLLTDDFIGQAISTIQNQANNGFLPNEGYVSFVERILKEYK